MIRSRESKLAIIDELQTSLQKGQHLRMLLLLHRDDEGVRRVTSRNRALMREIDRLIAGAMEEWSGTAKGIVDDLKGCNRRLQSSIRDLKKGVRRSDRVAKALGQLDRVLARAKGLL